MNLDILKKTALTFAGLFTISFVILLFREAEGDALIIVLRAISVIGLLISLLYLYFSNDTKIDEKQTGTHQTHQQITPEEVDTYYDELLDAIFSLAKAVHPDYQIAVYMVDSIHGGQMLQKATSNIFEKNISHDDKLITALMSQKGTSILQQKDVRDNWKVIFQDKTWRGSECFLGNRIMYRNNPVGSVLLYMEHFSDVEKRDKNILNVLSNLISMGLERLDKISELFLKIDYQSFLSNLYSTIDLKSSEQDIYQSILPLCRTFFSYDKLTISVGNDSEKATVKFVDGIQENVEIGATFSLQSSLHGMCIESKEIVQSRYWSQDYPNKVRFNIEEESDYNFSSVLFIPFVIMDQNACFALERVSSRPFTENDKQSIEMLASVLSSVLSWHTEYQHMYKSATHDGLTGLLNHRTFMIRFEEELNRAVRFQQTFVLSMLDLDKFKRVNDTFGHYFGDYVIKTVAQIIKESVRNIDVVARYGGEEYVIILVDTNKEKAQIVANRIVKNIEAFLFEQDEIHTRLTISAGLAEFPKDSDMAKGLIEKADEAMYDAKKLGGNTFCNA